MPPKSRPFRKGSTASRTTNKDASAPSSSAAVPSPSSKVKPLPKAAGTMAPPPSPMPKTILGPEVQALEESLKEAALHTGRIFRFYADARKERIVSHAPYPPRSLVHALGRSLERYDQICDTIETQLLHAISIFERDMKVEQARLDAEASASVATRTRSKRPSVSPTASRIPLPNTSPPPPGPEQQTPMDSPVSMQSSSQFAPQSGASAISTAPRRHSTILSSLQRLGFPLKLDLSPATLAGSIDPTAMGPPMDVNVDLGLTSLPSPVTLVPKTARAMPNDPSMSDMFDLSSQSLTINPGDVPNTGPIPGSVGTKTPQGSVIDLTGPDASARGTTQLGDSADKPIELDLEGSYEDMDLFGDVETTHNPGAANTTADAGGVAGPSTQLDVDMEELFTPRDDKTNAFQLDGEMGQNSAPSDPGAILASLASGAPPAGPGSSELSSLLPISSGQPGENNADGLPDQTSGDTFTGLGTGDAGTQFDLSGIDLSSFSGLFDAQEGATGEGGGEEMDLLSLLAMSGGDNMHTSGPADSTST